MDHCAVLGGDDLKALVNVTKVGFLVHALPGERLLLVLEHADAGVDGH